MPVEPFEMSLAVDVADIDELGHVNNIVYLRWVQEVATAHWNAVAHAEDRAALLWMVVRHEIDYHAATLANDEIVLRTWIGTAVGLRFDRHTEVLRRNDRKVLATARTIWIPIDPTTGRPKRVPERVRTMFSTLDT